MNTDPQIKRDQQETNEQDMCGFRKGHDEKQEKNQTGILSLFIQMTYTSFDCRVFSSQKTVFIVFYE